MLSSPCKLYDLKAEDFNLKSTKNAVISDDSKPHLNHIQYSKFDSKVLFGMYEFRILFCINRTNQTMMIICSTRYYELECYVRLSITEAANDSLV